MVVIPSDARPMTNRDAVVACIEDAGYEDEGLLLADGYEQAFIGVAVSAGRKPVAVYDIDQCVRVLMQRDGMTHEEAEEFFSFNTLGAYVGDQTPLFIQRMHPNRARPPRATLSVL